ncbi:MAG: hypothetical protein ABI905_08535 [Betaproteobacteria bacterium]
MKSVSVAMLIASALMSAAAISQVPSIPPAPPAPPVQAEPPVAPAPPAPVVPAVAGKGAVVEGKLFRTERQKNDKGQATWVCTYSVGGSKRAVALDESCPSEMTFQMKR